MTMDRTGSLARGNSNDHLRRHNLSVILDLVHHERGMSRSQLTGRTGLNRSTIGGLVNELVDRKLVIEEGAQSSNQVGRPSPMVRPGSVPVGIAVNPEVDAITLGVVGLGGVLITTVRRSLESIPTAAEAVTVAAEMVDALRPSLAKTHRIVGIGAAIPGLVRSSDGLVRLAPHLNWVDEPFAALLAKATGLSVSAANDARLGARGERAFGAGRGIDDLLYVNGGASGIGGGIISAGRPLGGEAGYAGELGHTMVNPGGTRCHCGATGCLETEVRRDRLLEVTGLTPETLDRLASELRKPQNQRVTEEVERQVAFLATALRNAVNLLNPRLILLGGFLAALHNADPSGLGDVGALRASAEGLEIREAELGNDLLMIGAGELALESLIADPGAFTG